jgi:glycosyltransferase involved in cell wall biosynthesis
MKLSVIIPCYNERETIKEIVNAVRCSPYDDKEIIIVDDCSTDGTRELLKAEIAPNVDQVLFHQRYAPGSRRPPAIS